MSSMAELTCTRASPSRISAVSECQVRRSALACRRAVRFRTTFRSRVTSTESVPVESSQATAWLNRPADARTRPTRPLPSRSRTSASILTSPSGARRGSSSRGTAARDRLRAYRPESGSEPVVQDRCPEVSKPSRPSSKVLPASQVLVGAVCRSSLVQAPARTVGQPPIQSSRSIMVGRPPQWGSLSWRSKPLVRIQSWPDLSTTFAEWPVATHVLPFGALTIVPPTCRSARPTPSASLNGPIGSLARPTNTG